MSDPINPIGESSGNRMTYVQQMDIKPIQVEEQSQEEEIQASPLKTDQTTAVGDTDEKDRASANLSASPKTLQPLNSSDSTRLSKTATEYVTDRKLVQQQATSVGSEPTTPPAYTESEDLEPTFKLTDKDFSNVQFGNIQDGTVLT